MKRLVGFVILAFSFFLYFSSYNQAFAASKTQSFYFPKVNINIRIDTDSSIYWTEQRTFSFSGSFTRVYWDIPLDFSQKIDQVSISDEVYQPFTQIPAPSSSRPDGEFAANFQNGVEHIEAYHSSTDVQRTFTLTYHLTGAITKYSDVAEFYWKVIGDSWTGRTDSATATVHLPADVGKENINAWGHGPLNGQVNIISGQIVTFTASNLKARRFLEVRITFPPNMLAGTALPETALPRIRAEEAAYQAKTRFQEQFNFVILIAAGIGTVVWIAFWIYIFFKKGKEYQTDVPKYVQFPPSKLKPALVEALVSQDNTVSPYSFSATILDLARKKEITIQEAGHYSQGILGIGSGMRYDYSLNLTDKPYQTSNNLDQYEKDLLNFVFQDGEVDSITVKDLSDSMKKNPMATRQFFTSWQKTVLELSKSQNNIEPASKKWQLAFIISNLLFTQVLALAFAYVLDEMDSWLALAGITLFFGAIIFGLGGRIFLRWTKEAEVQAKEWIGFRNYISGMSEFKNSLPQAVIIWEDILVYGTALGVAKKVAENLPMILNQPGVHPVVPAWYIASSSGTNVTSAVQGINTSFATNFSESMSSMVSSFNSSFSTGAGGGFSGGGGGGGGGGGAD